MNTELGLLLGFGPLVLIAVSAITFRLFASGRSPKQLASSPPPSIDPVRLDLARSIAATMLAPQLVPDDNTIAEVLLLRDSRKPTHAAKLLKSRTGASLTDTRRLLDRLP